MIWANYHEFSPKKQNRPNHHLVFYLVRDTGIPGSVARIAIVILKTSIAPENWWLEDEISDKNMVPFRRTFAHFQRVTWKSSIWSLWSYVHPRISWKKCHVKWLLTLTSHPSSKVRFSHHHTQQTGTKHWGTLGVMGGKNLLVWLLGGSPN